MWKRPTAERHRRLVTLVTFLVSRYMPVHYVLSSSETFWFLVALLTFTFRWGAKYITVLAVCHGLFQHYFTANLCHLQIPLEIEQTLTKLLAGPQRNRQKHCQILTYFYYSLSSEPSLTAWDCTTQSEIFLHHSTEFGKTPLV